MKKIIALLAVALICASLAACTQQEASADTTENNVTDNVTTKAEETTEPETEAQTKPATDWKSEAKKLLDPLKETSDTYCLYDMNGDEVPELIILSGESAAQTQYSLYDLTKPEAAPLQFGSGNSVVGGYEGNSLILLYGKMGEQTITKYTYDGTKIDSVILSTVDIPVGEDYTEIDELKFTAANDESGLNWTKNPEENNANTVKAIG